MPSAEYWHIGETTSLFFIVSPRIVSGEKSLLIRNQSPSVLHESSQSQNSILLAMADIWRMFYLKNAIGIAFTSVLY